MRFFIVLFLGFNLLAQAEAAPAKSVWEQWQEHGEKAFNKFLDPNEPQPRSPKRECERRAEMVFIIYSLMGPKPTAPYVKDLGKGGVAYSFDFMKPDGKMADPSQNTDLVAKMTTIRFFYAPGKDAPDEIVVERLGPDSMVFIPSDKDKPVRVRHEGCIFRFLISKPFEMTADPL